MKHLILVIACAGLLVGCATDTTSDSTGTSGRDVGTTSGSATNSVGNTGSPHDGTSGTGAQPTP
jgi:hypothetical protein